MKHPHPSDRPINRAPDAIGRPRWNIPDDGYVTPRLRHQRLVGAIGFTTGKLPGHQDDEADYPWARVNNARGQHG